MNRRLLIKQLIVIAGGTILVPFCLRSYNPNILFNHFALSAVQLDLIAQLSEVILPLEKLGLISEEKLHLFVIKMVDECAEPQNRDFFISGLFELQAIVNDKYESKSLTDDEYIEIVEDLEREQFTGNIPEFYKIFKNELINGYINSKYFMTNVIKYELLPGRYVVHFSVI